MVIQWPVFERRQFYFSIKSFYNTSPEAKSFGHISTLPKAYTLPCFGFCKCDSQRRESLAFEEPLLISWTWYGLVDKVIIEGWITYVTQWTHDSHSASTEYRSIFIEWNNSFVFVDGPKKGWLVPCPAAGFIAFHHTETDVWAIPSVVALNCHGNPIHHHMLSHSQTPYHHHATASSSSLPS